MKNQQNRETITLGGGCFWCTEAVFAALKGVISVTPGYAGGESENPTYEEVCSGNTGHAEVVQICFDPLVINLEMLLRVFFAAHDPTTPNRQGADVGTQYRSVIFYENESQKSLAMRMIQEIDRGGEYEQPICTELTLLNRFYPAELVHMRFYEQNSEIPYCQWVIKPKLKKILSLFADLHR